MNTSPSVIVFDVNETLSDMSPLASRFGDIGVPDHLAKLWFSSLLRDGFALAAAGDNGRFAEIGAEALRILLAPLNLNRSVHEAVGHVMEGMQQLRLHPGIADALNALKAEGRRMITLSNGSPAIAEKLFRDAGIRDAFESLLSVEDAPAWKPARTAYEYAATTCQVELRDMLLVAVHPWDIHGAAAAGMHTVWLNPSGGPYPGYFTHPQHTIGALSELSTILT